MADHKLASGKQVIDNLLALGTILGYHTEKEFPLEGSFRNNQVIDVAWFSEKGQEFPLMIFEVESRPSNTIANNPMKIYGKPNYKLEKPLFFFHIVNQKPHPEGWGMLWAALRTAISVFVDSEIV